jgi:hypothetical protein
MGEFDYDGLILGMPSGKLFYNRDTSDAADYLRTRIEAAFVPVDQADDHSTCHRDGCSLTGIPYGLASCGCWDTEIRARAESAEARVKVLEEALRELRGYGCPVCNGDCGSANPPVISCPMQRSSQALGAEPD